MANMKYIAYRTVFEIMWATQASRLIRQMSRSLGVIFTLHRVLPETPAPFSPNSILQITPEFLEYVIIRVRELGMDIVSLDEAVKRIKSPEKGNKFVVFTFDDAYRDNLVHALPVLKRRNCPFTLYVPTALVDGVGEVWWQALEDIIAKQEAIAYSADNGDLTYHDTKTASQKQVAYDDLYWRMRKMPEDKRVEFFAEFASGYGVNMDEHCRSLIMDWAELQTFQDEPLCTIGAHTVHHYELAKLPEEQARQEMALSAEIIMAQFGSTPKHLSFPIGGLDSAGEREYKIARDLGFDSAVTTRPGGVYARHKEQLTALPRISLNGQFQQQRYVDTLATGALFSMMSRA